MLQKNGLTAKPSKCVWGMEKVEYLGHRIGKGQVAVPEARTQAISKFQKLQKQSDFRAFLGVTGYYYRKFIRHYAFIAQPCLLPLERQNQRNLFGHLKERKHFIC